MHYRWTFLLAATWQLSSYASVCSSELLTMKHRLVAQGYSEIGIDLAVRDFALALSEYGGRLADPNLQEALNQGIWFHADSPEDIRNAGRALRQGVRASEVYFTRLAVFSSAVQKSGYFLKGVLALASLDRSLRERGIFWDAQERAVVHRPSTPSNIQQLKEIGVSVSLNPVYGVSFNDGNHFNMSSLYPWELEAAQYLSREEKDELFIGLGDKGVRQFHRFYAEDECEGLVSFMPTADFLTLQLTSHGPGFVVREMKNAEATSPVKIEVALAQLRSTATQIGVRYPEIPVLSVEILVPARGKTLNPRYSLSEAPLDESRSLYALIHTQSGRPVQMETPLVTLPVLVRLLAPRAVNP